MDELVLERVGEVLRRYGKSRARLYEDIEDELFPRQIRIGKRSVAWLKSEVDELIRARVAGASEGQLRELVQRLHEARQQKKPR